MTVANIMTIAGLNEVGPFYSIWPQARTVSESIPSRPRQFLLDAMQSPPSAAIMTAASALDAMLKDQKYKTGALFPRIEDAAKNHLITEAMKDWAHEIRLDANDQRHADEHAAPATREDADRVIEFALALAEYLYVLPARVQRGRGKPEGTAKPALPTTPTEKDAKLAAAMAVKSK